MASTGQGVLGNNMFAYCNNNPVLFADSAGYRCIPAFHNTREGFFREGATANKHTVADDIAERKKKADETLDYLRNTDEQVVLTAKFAAFYKGRFVIKVPGTNAGFSCGIMFIGSEAKSAATVKHEYGHTKQLDALGLPAYLGTVATPSVICYALTELKVIPREYYFSLPWERKADELGQTTDIYIPGSKEISDAYYTGAKLMSRLFG